MLTNDEPDNDGGIEMAKDEDVQDLDQIFESDDNIEIDDQNIVESYMASEEDYKSDIGSNNTDDDMEEEYEESVNNLLIDSESDTNSKIENDNILEENVSEDEPELKRITGYLQKPNDKIPEFEIVVADNIKYTSDENKTEETIESNDSPEINETDLIIEESNTDEDSSDINEESEEDMKSESDIIDEMVNPVVEQIETNTNKESEKDNEEDFESDDLVDEIEKDTDDSEIKKSEENTSENDPGSSYKDFKREAFWKAVRETQDRYPETDLIEYIDQYKNKDNNAEIIKEMYSNVLIEYDEFIDFNNDEEARNNAWIIVGGKFADLIERRKAMGIIESTVEVKHLGKVKDVDEIDDPNTQASAKDRKRHKEEIDKYSIDRTVFAIASDESEEDVSIFEDKKAVDREFYEGPFYKILKEVMISDRCADMSKIYMKVIINPETSFIPVVDFSTGVRFVCIDTSDVDQYRIHALALARQVQFSFSNVNPRNIKTRVLYSDMCKQRPVATIFAIKKLVAFEYWNPKHKITLQHNFAIAYTTENNYVEMFENGDPDSKNPENCVNVARKPKTCSFGVIALDKKSEKDRQAMRRKQGKKVLDYINNNNFGDEPNRNDYNIHFVLSASVICNDRDLVNPGIPAEDRMVHYEITRYCECNSVIILDGLQTICTCIIKEHKKKYGPGTKYTIEFDYDPTELLTPGVVGLIDAHDGIELSTYKKSNPMSITCSYIMPPSRLKMDGVFEFEKGRMDYRNFNPATLSIYYPRELYTRYNINTIEGRAEFLRSRGFEEFWQPAVATFDIMPYALNIIEVGSFINEISHVNISTLGDRDSNDFDGLLYQQQKLEYVKNLDNSSYSGLQKFLFGVLDFLIDSQSNQN